MDSISLIGLSGQVSAISLVSHNSLIDLTPHHTGLNRLIGLSLISHNGLVGFIGLGVSFISHGVSFIGSFVCFTGLICNISLIGGFVSFVRLDLLSLGS
jgi:hypothetical protein